jgi:hypothetical protein
MQVKLTEDEIREAIKVYLEKKGIMVGAIDLGSRQVMNGLWSSHWATATITETTTN